MLPLKSVPQMLRSRSTNTGRLLTHSTSGLRHSSLAETDTASQTPSEASTAVSQLEHEEKELKERLIVLEEQRFMVQDMLKVAAGGRRFEEVGALRRNLEELEGEIGDVRGKIGGVEERFEGVYRNGVS